LPLQTTRMISQQYCVPPSAAYVTIERLWTVTEKATTGSRKIMFGQKEIIEL